MKVSLPLRIIVNNPLDGVLLKVQSGKFDLIAASENKNKQAIFDLEIDADISTDQPNFLGKVSQGPKNDRFIYLNWGVRAGQPDTFWDRRAKLSLMSISKKDVEKVLEQNKKLEVEIEGIGKDGGPVCANVKGLSWKVA